MTAMYAWWLIAACGATRFGVARELDAEACTTRFDVQRDKIIRTEESREMGARYLSELDVGSRQECLRLCCETDSCDVFVFEEKSPGSCYLFNCGPPEDFRCKFTAHGNFSSGVLALSRHLAELQDQERLAQHERDLAGLRVKVGDGVAASGAKPAPGAHPASSTARTSIATAPPPAPRTLPPPTPPAMHSYFPPTTDSSGCSRYQFACRSGGECVAVYNACDGIPQCADGSDEAPELGCPQPVHPIDRSIEHDTQQTQQSVQPLQPVLTGQSEQTVQVQHRIRPHQNMMQVNMQEIPVLGGDLMPVLGDNFNDGSNAWPHRLLQAQPSPPRYSVGESMAGPHIFSHTGGLLQENRRGPGALQGEMGWGESPRSRLEWPAQPPAWPRVPLQEGPMYAEVPQYSQVRRPMVDAPKKRPPEQEQSEPQEQPEPAPPPARPVTQKPYIAVTIQPTPPAVEVPLTKTKEVKPSSEAKDARHEHFSAPDDHEGLNEHSASAIMLLILGVCMTAAVVALGVSRVRRVGRRRGRRRPHDPDYLVNGMYL